MCNSLKIVTTIAIVVGIQVIAAGAAVTSVHASVNHKTSTASLSDSANISQAGMANKGSDDFAPPQNPPPRRTQGSGTR